MAVTMAATVKTPARQAMARMPMAACCQAGHTLLAVAILALVLAISFTKFLHAALEAWWAGTCTL